MHSSDIETRSPEREEHVELAGRLHAAHVVGEPDQVVGGLAHGAHHDDDVVALTARPGDVVGDGPDAVGVADRGPAELLHDQGHETRRYLLPSRAPDPGPAGPGPEWRPVGCRAVPSDKRSRKRAAREAKLAALQRQRKRRAAIRRTVTIVVIVGVAIGIYALVSSGSSRQARTPRRAPRPPPGHHDHEALHRGVDDPLRLHEPAGARRRRRPDDGGHRRGHRRRVPVQPEDAPRRSRRGPRPRRSPSTRRRPTSATVKTDVGTFTVSLDAEHGPEDGEQLRVPGRPRLLQLRDLPPRHPGIRRSRAATPPARAPAGRATSSPTRLPAKRAPVLPAGVAGHGQLRAPNTNGSQFFIVIGSQGEQLPAELLAVRPGDLGVRRGRTRSTADGAPSNDPTGTGAPDVIHRMLKVSVAVQ